MKWNNTIFCLLILVACITYWVTHSSEPENNLPIEESAQLDFVLAEVTSRLKQNPDSAKYYALQALFWADSSELKGRLSEVYLRLGDVFRKSLDYDSAYYYYQLGIASLDSTNHLIAGKLYNNRGILFKKMGLYDSAVLSYKMSFEAKQKDRNVSGQLSSLENMANVLLHQGRSQEARVTYLKVLTRLSAIGDTVRLASTYQNLGNVCSYTGDYEQAIEYYDHALQYYKIIGNTKGQIDIHINHGNVQMYQGEFELAINHYYKSLQGTDSLDMVLDRADVLFNIAMVLEKQKLLDQAKVCWNKALEIYRKYELNESMASVHNALANVYAKEKNWKMGLSYALKSLQAYDSLNFKSELGELYNTLGILYNIKGDLKESLYYLSKSKSEHQKNKDWRSLAQANNSLGKVFFEQAHTDSAIYYFEQSLKLAEKFNHREIAKRASFGLIESYLITQRKNEALSELWRYDQLNNDLFNQKQSAAIAEMQSRYESEKKQRKINQLTYESELQRAGISKKNAEVQSLVLGGTLLLLLLIIAYLGYRKKRAITVQLASKNRLIQTQINELEMLHKELHHRVKNNLQLISSLLGIQSLNSKDKKITQALKLGRSRVEAMSLIHKNLYFDKQFTQVNIKSYIESLCQNFEATYDDKAIKFKLDIVDHTLNVDQTIPIGLILNEVVCNSFKYAVPAGASLIIKISFCMYEESMSLVVSDNGTVIENIGQDLDPAPQGFGISLIESLSRQLRAHLEQGFTATGAYLKLNLPIEKVEQQEVT